jgi:3-methyladenine DNA glycosylase Mpg
VSGAGASKTPGAARTWVCFFAPPAAWYLYQQGLGMVVRVACGSAGTPQGPLLGAAALLVCVITGALAFDASRHEASEPPARTRRFIARVTVGIAGVLGLAIAFQTIATLLVPPCAR